MYPNIAYSLSVKISLIIWPFLKVTLYFIFRREIGRLLGRAQNTNKSNYKYLNHTFFIDARDPLKGPFPLFLFSIATLLAVWLTAYVAGQTEAAFQALPGCKDVLSTGL